MIDLIVKTCRHKFQQTSDIFKTEGKLKIMRDSIEDEYVTHTMTTRNIISVQ